MAVRLDGQAHQGMPEVTGGDGGQLGHRGRPRAGQPGPACRSGDGHRPGRPPVGACRRAAITGPACGCGPWPARWPSATQANEMPIFLARLSSPKPDFVAKATLPQTAWDPAAPGGQPRPQLSGRQCLPHPGAVDAGVASTAPRWSAFLSGCCLAPTPGG
jgi:hypothetical protein